MVRSQNAKAVKTGFWSQRANTGVSNSACPTEPKLNGSVCAYSNTALAATPLRAIILQAKIDCKHFVANQPEAFQLQCKYSSFS